MIQTLTSSQGGHQHPAVSQSRIGNRRQLRVPGRLTWRDASGALRFVSVVTRDVSDVDAFVECQVPASIPLYRLVHKTNGDHFYTTSSSERASALAGSYLDEGVAGYVWDGSSG